MARYIDADELCYEIYTDTSIPYYDAMKDVIYLIKRLKQTEDVRPVVKGKWIEKKAKDDQRYLQCSVCGRNKMDLTYDDFCKYCGADMREVEE